MSLKLTKRLVIGLACYLVLGVMASLTLTGRVRLVTLAVLALYVVKTMVSTRDRIEPDQ